MSAPIAPATPVWGGRRVPFTLLGGYLGAGKTTILNRVLATASGWRIVVLVNDVAAINVDASLVADHDGPTLTLTNGCVCCAIADDLGATLELVRAMPEPPDHVLMELSGVADPARVSPWAGTAGFGLDAIVVAVDADQVVELAARRFVGDTVVAQLEAADVVVLTKTDLAGDHGAAARRFVAERTPAPIVDAVGGAIGGAIDGGIDGAIEVAVVLGGAAGSTAPRSARSTTTVEVPHDVGHEAAVLDVGHEAAVLDVGTPTLDALQRLVDGLPGSVVRAKGLVRCTDQSVPIEVHVVGRRRVVRRRPDLDRDRASQHLALITPRS